MLKKNVFGEDLSHKNLEIISNEMQIQGEKTIVVNIYIPPGIENDVHILDWNWKNTRVETYS